MRRILVAMALVSIGLAPVPATAGSPHHCFGEVPTVVGTHGDDTLQGDVVVGRGGRDIIHARLACGNSGDDLTVFGHEKASGGPGDDEFVASPGSLVEGGDGYDNLFSWSESSQVLRGEEGNDEWVAKEDGGETDFFYGGPGDDRTAPPDGIFEQDTRQFGGEGNDEWVAKEDGGETDFFYGGPGDDRTAPPDGIFEQDTRQYGEEGNDDLAGGGGLDKLYGGRGDDTLSSVKYGEGRGDGFSDLLRGGDGFDTCILEASDRAVSCEVVEVVG